MKRTPETSHYIDTPKKSLLRSKSLQILTLIGAISGAASNCATSTTNVQTNSPNSSTNVRVINGRVVECKKNGNGKQTIIVNGREIECDK
jgi:hypothetical protein